MRRPRRLGPAWSYRASGALHRTTYEGGPAKDAPLALDGSAGGWTVLGRSISGSRRREAQAVMADWQWWSLTCSVLLPQAVDARAGLRGGELPGVQAGISARARKEPCKRSRRLSGWGCG